MGEIAGVIPLDADAIVVVGRIADYHAGRIPPDTALLDEDLLFQLGDMPVRQELEKFLPRTTRVAYTPPTQRPDASGGIS
jgi:hypothetical protein